MAHVPGRQPARDLKHASDDYGEVTCQPCGGDGKQIPAKSYCEDCKEYLCDTCSKEHKRFKALSHHKLIGVSNVLPGIKKKQGSKPAINCHVHTDKLIEYFCQTHSQLLCVTCAVTKHTSCKPDYIPDISLDFLNSGQLKEIKAKLQLMLKKVKQSINLTDDNIKLTEEQRKRLIAELEQYREKLVKYINEMVNELKAETEKLHKEELHKLQQVKDNLDNYKRELQDTENYLEKLEEKSSDLFIACQARMIQLQELQDQINEADGKNNVNTYCFEVSDVSRKMLSTEKAVGVLMKKLPQNQDPTPLSIDQHDNQTNQTRHLINLETCQIVAQSDLNVKSPTDKSTCDVTGVELFEPNVLLLSDYNNVCVKKIDTKTGEMIGNLPLADLPWDLTILPEDRAAVTLYRSNKIQFIFTQGRLSLLHDVKVNGYCRGICSTTDGQLVVSFSDPGKIEVLDERGIVLSCISTDDLAMKVINRPLYVYVSNENNEDVIYVSDRGINRLIKLTKSGQVLTTYSDNELIRPYGLTVADGHLLICGCGSHNVQIVNTSGQTVRTILCKRDGILKPQCVCYSSQNKTVYVARFGSDTIKVYQLQ